MKQRLKNLVKGNRIVYRSYYYLCSILLRIWGLFIRTEDNLILCVVYGGKRYDDSPRFVYEYMRNRKEYDQYKFVWAFQQPEQIAADVEFKVKIDSLKYYYFAMKAGFWLTNSSASRGLKFKKKKTVNVFFTHGMTGIKLSGSDIPGNNQSFKNGFKEKFDYIVIEGKQEENIINRAWNLDKGTILMNIGLPRNDELAYIDDKKVIALKKKLGIPLDKKVILYAPTFREFRKDGDLACYLVPPFDFDMWNKKLGKEYVLLLTAHYEVQKLMDVPKNHPFVINAFEYPYINDLMICADILISDYSSIIFDFSILEKPILSYAYDYEVYQKERGVYPGYEGVFCDGVLKSEDEVIRCIQNMDYDAECKYTAEKIKSLYISNYGNAAEIFVQSIFDGRRRDQYNDDHREIK